MEKRKIAWLENATSGLNLKGSKLQTFLTSIDFLYLEEKCDKYLGFVFSFYTQQKCEQEFVKYIIV